MSGWLTIFDVTAEPFRWGNAGEGLAALAMLALGASGFLALRRRGARGATGVLAIAAGVAVFFAVRTLDHQHEHEACVEAARQGDGRVLEGPIERFQPVRSMWQRPWDESFTVAGVTLRYALFTGSCGFHQTVAEGGPLREGMHVRLLEWRGRILKLDLAEGEVAAPDQDHDHGLR